MNRSGRLPETAAPLDRALGRLYAASVTLTVVGLVARTLLVRFYWIVGGAETIALLVGLGLGLAAGAAVLLAVRLRGMRPTRVDTLAALVLSAAAGVGCTTSLLPIADCAIDGSPAIEVTATVVRADPRQPTYEVEADQPFASRRFDHPNGEHRRTLGERRRFLFHRGRLGIPWVSDARDF
jgi:hypothetical protein